MGPIHQSLSLPAPLVLGITPRSAHLISLLFTASYVGSLYLAQTIGLPRYLRSRKVETTETRPQLDMPTIVEGDAPKAPEVGSRDHPATIKIRMKAVSTATGLSIAGVYLMVKQNGQYTWSRAPTLALLGFPSSLTAPTLHSIAPYLLAPAILFGPLVAMYLDEDLPLQRPVPGGDGILARVKNAWRSWSLVETRNYVVGPLTEELVFRSTILAACLLGKISFKALVFGTPLWFGIAHAHHAWDTYKRKGGGRKAAAFALGSTAFQLTYTTLFGWFASYLFLRTGSVLPPLVSHMFCNYMGIYLPTTAVERQPRQKLLIWSCYILGIAGFIAGLRRL